MGKEQKRKAKLLKIAVLGHKTIDTSFCKKLNKVECGVFVNTEQTLDGIKEDYCKAIVTLGRDKELAKQMGLNGYKYVNKYLTWETKYKVILKDFV